MNFRNWMVFKQSTEFADPLESNDDLMKNARKSPYFNAGMDRAKLT